MNILFWNTAGRTINSVLASLAIEHQIDVLVLAEYSDDPVALLGLLRASGADYKIVPKIACDRITMLSIYPTHEIRHCRDGDRHSIKEIRPKNGIPLLLAMVHLVSKLHTTEDDQAVRASLVREEIEEAEDDCGHANTMVIGDFNMNPFEKGMVSVAAFNSIPCIRASQKSSREMGGREYRFFYNPSWNLLGDRNDSAGTYFHRSPGSLSHYWNTLDQVLLRPNLAPIVVENSLRSITKTGATALIKADSTPSASDHLPIALTINLEKETV